jgi:hypothetical protein
MPLHRKCHPSVHNTGMKRTDEQKANIKAAIQRNVAAGKYRAFLGKTHTDEAKQAISEKALERAQSLIECDKCDQKFTVHVLAIHMKLVHDGKSYYNSPGTRSIAVNSSRETVSKSWRWCDECQRSYTHLLWPRHIRKYHEGGDW